MRFVASSWILVLGFSNVAWAAAVDKDKNDEPPLEGSLLRGGRQQRKQLAALHSVAFKPRPATAAVKSLRHLEEQLPTMKENARREWLDAIAGTGEDGNNNAHETIMMSITRSLVDVHNSIFGEQGYGQQQLSADGGDDKDDTITRKLIATFVVDDEKNKEVMASIVRTLVDIQKSISIMDNKVTTENHLEDESDAFSRRLVEATKSLASGQVVLGSVFVEESNEMMSWVENLRKALREYANSKDKASLALELKSTISTLQSTLDESVAAIGKDKRRRLAGDARGHDELTVRGKTILNEIITSLSVAAEENAAIDDVGTVAVIQEFATLLAKFPDYGVLGDDNALLLFAVIFLSLQLILIIIEIITLPIWLPVAIVAYVIYLLFFLYCENGGQDIPLCNKNEMKRDRDADGPWNSR